MRSDRMPDRSGPSRLRPEKAHTEAVETRHTLNGIATHYLDIVRAVVAAQPEPKRTDHPDFHPLPAFHQAARLADVNHPHRHSRVRVAGNSTIFIRGLAEWPTDRSGGQRSCRGGGLEELTRL